MDSLEFTRTAHTRAVDFKTTRVQENGAKASVPFFVVGNRGSEHVATFFPRDRDEMLWATRLAIGAFGCDLVAATVDAYEVTADLPPGTKGIPPAGNIARRNPDAGPQGDMQGALHRAVPGSGIAQKLAKANASRAAHAMFRPRAPSPRPSARAAQTQPDRHAITESPWKDGRWNS